VMEVRRSLDILINFKQNLSNHVIYTDNNTVLFSLIRNIVTASVHRPKEGGGRASSAPS